MYTNIDNQNFKNIKNQPGVIIVDVRTPKEIAEGIIPGASKFMDANSNDFAEQIEKLDKSKSYIVYCRSGARSGKACRIMEEKGFKGKLFNLALGISNWDGEIIQAK